MIAIVLLVVSIALLTAASVVLAIGFAGRRRPWQNRTTRRLALSACAWTLVVGAWLLLGTVWTTSSSGTTTNPTPAGRTTDTVTTTSTESLLEHEGATVIPVLLVPVALAVVGAAGRGPSARWRRIGVGWLLVGFSLLGAASIGLFYLPAALALVVAGVKTPTHDVDGSASVVP